MVDSKGDRWAKELICSKTDEKAPLDEATFLSAAGAPWLVDYDLDPEKGQDFRRRLLVRPWTLWRYRELLPIADFRNRIDLGEGGTPLVRLRRTAPPGVRVLIKEEGGNPTGSFKDRGLSMAVNRAKELGAEGVELASAGNAALALTAYAAAGGLKCRVAMPEDTPASILQRCRAMGAEVLTSPGTLVDAAGRLKEFDDGYWNLSTLKEPYRAEGKKTMGLELAEQLGWRLPDWILYPTGGGTGIVGMHKAFAELETLGLIGSHRPRFAVVQMAGCAPMVKAFEEGKESADPWQNAQTRVWGLRVPQAIGDFLILRALRETGGTALAIEEERLLEVLVRMAREEGLRLGPEGAACVAAMEDLAARGDLEPGQTVVIFQTGNPDNYL
ncbi:MAG: threonine synthase [Deltaproteobacteria bacterium]|nr:threonine synthase [Deltaproteobacteria bacterium]